MFLVMCQFLVLVSIILTNLVIWCDSCCQVKTFFHCAVYLTPVLIFVLRHDPYCIYYLLVLLMEFNKKHVHAFVTILKVHSIISTKLNSLWSKEIHVQLEEVVFLRDTRVAGAWKPMVLCSTTCPPPWTPESLVYGSQWSYVQLPVFLREHQSSWCMEANGLALFSTMDIRDKKGSQWIIIKVPNTLQTCTLKVPKPKCFDQQLVANRWKSQVVSVMKWIYLWHCT